MISSHCNLYKRNMHVEYVFSKRESCNNPLVSGICSCKNGRGGHFSTRNMVILQRVIHGYFCYAARFIVQRAGCFFIS